jgi:superfamily I DNA/RNA helicase
MQPIVARVEPEELLAEAIAASRTERDAVGDGRVAVITPIATLDELADRLQCPSAGGHGGLSASDARKVLDAPLSVLTLDVARGLEFDSVVLVEPSRLVAEHAQGLRALYVALTRTTKRLHIVHAEALPESLRAAVATAEAELGSEAARDLREPSAQ